MINKKNETPLDQFKKHVDIGTREVKNNNQVASLKSFKLAYNIAKKFGINGPDADQAKHFLALNYYVLHDYENALKIYEQLPIGDSRQQFDRAVCYLSAQNLNAGLSLYSNRHFKKIAEDRESGLPKPTYFPNLPIPYIMGGYEGKKLLILNEQGYGDEIMFMRSISELAKYVTSATVQVYSVLGDVFKSAKLPSNITLLPSHKFATEFATEFDAWTFLGDVWTKHPLAPQIEVHNGMINQMLDRSKVNIGFVDSTGNLSNNIALRSINESFFKKIACMSPDIVMHNLQITKDVDFAHNYRERITSFFDTLAIIENMDLVITVDTSVAHLAACSKTKTILVYSEYLDWRWKNGFYQNVEIVQKDDLLKKLKDMINEK